MQNSINSWSVIITDHIRFVFFNLSDHLMALMDKRENVGCLKHVIL